MKTKKTILVSSSDNVLNFNFPKSWQELTQEQLKTVLVFLSAYSPTNALVRIVCYFANLIIVRKLQTGSFLCILVKETGQHSITLSSEEFTAMCDVMQWVHEPGNYPVLLGEYCNRRSINKLLHGVPFEKFIMLDNLFQGYLVSRNDEAVARMANIIFESKKPLPKLKPYMLFGIVLWFTQLKAYFSIEFTNFFRPMAGCSPSLIKEAMNAQIRALTGGDVTKEQEVLAIDTWRALTELDAKAREAEEFKNSMNK
ncbi:MAG: hypothetical protein E7089_08970 [Bacteroidales bacterium]|nr:hypothetical protein [Bacteroidales bacterium]